MEKFKGANQLYKESGSDLSFKEWLGKQKQSNIFIFNPKLNKHIMANEQMNEGNFHSDNGAKTDVPASVPPKQKLHVSFNKKDIVVISVISVLIILGFILHKTIENEG